MSENYAKVKSTSKWASDDNAGSLLADILDETEDLAQREQQRLEEDLRAKRMEQERQTALEEERRRQEAEARISAEHDRQAQLKERRTQRMEALRIEELKDRGEWVEPAPQAPAKEQPHAQVPLHAPPPEAAPAPLALQAAAPPAQTSKALPLAILGLVAAMVLGAVGVIAFMLSQGYSPDTANYATVQLSPEASRAVVALQGFTPLPKEEPVAIVPPEPEEKKPRRSRIRRADRPEKSKGSKYSNREAKKGKREFILNLSDDDLFGGK